MTSKSNFVSVLLDETGSMHPIKDATLAGLNNYIDSLREEHVLFSLVSFNSSNTRRLYVADPIGKVKTLTAKDYRPDAMTPLIDAAVKLIDATDEAVATREDDPLVVVVFQTDGEENCSVEYTPADLALRIKEKTKAGWQFVFLGANLDAFAVARRSGINIPDEQVMSYAGPSSASAWGATSKNVKDYLRTGLNREMVFSSEQRGASRDIFADKYLDKTDADTDKDDAKARADDTAS